VALDDPIAPLEQRRRLWHWRSPAARWCCWAGIRSRPSHRHPPRGRAASRSSACWRFCAATNGSRSVAAGPSPPAPRGPLARDTRPDADPARRRCAVGREGLSGPVRAAQPAREGSPQRTRGRSRPQPRRGRRAGSDRRARCGAESRRDRGRPRARVRATAPRSAAAPPAAADRGRRRRCRARVARVRGPVGQAGRADRDGGRARQHRGVPGVPGTVQAAGADLARVWRPVLKRVRLPAL
jgi:hypothetical protein